MTAGPASPATAIQTPTQTPSSTTRIEQSNTLGPEKTPAVAQAKVNISMNDS
jgi:hypothetical protein